MRGTNVSRKRKRAFSISRRLCSPLNITSTAVRLPGFQALFTVKPEMARCRVPFTLKPELSLLPGSEVLNRSKKSFNFRSQLIESLSKKIAINRTYPRYCGIVIFEIFDFRLQRIPGAEYAPKSSLFHQDSSILGQRLVICI